ncbi:MAG: SDR family NAD(P)-dependent oxidoreductase [Nitrospiraceae bacterium]|nr:SDR family NAD(P)-dependent oxidoreductase [Nitrospiraceae bacterium]
MEIKSVLVTGACGFIGWRTAMELSARGYLVTGVDNLNDYYDVRLKEYRLHELEGLPNFTFHRLDIEERTALDRLFEKERFDAVINLAARAGVRYSLEDPYVYMSTNAMGTLNLLEAGRRNGLKKFVLASTSSLYAGQKMPFVEDLPVNTPISPYAATKKAAEAMSYTYHYLYSLDVTVLRYFTVYGPAGRPDMSPFRFIKWTDEGKPLQIFGDGSQSRDFTYVDDIARSTVAAREAETGYEIINLGNNTPMKLSYMIELIEKYLGKKSKKEFSPFHKADMQATWAGIEKAGKILGWKPETSLEEGMEKTVRWHRENRAWLSSIKV